MGLKSTDLLYFWNKAVNSTIIVGLLAIDLDNFKFHLQTTPY